MGFLLNITFLRQWLLRQSSLFDGSSYFSSYFFFIIRLSLLGQVTEISTQYTDGMLADVSMIYHK